MRAHQEKERVLQPDAGDGVASGDGGVGGGGGGGDGGGVLTICNASS